MKTPLTALFLTVVGVAGIAPAPRLARAVETYHGLQCQAQYASRDRIGFGEPGVINHSTQDARVFCATPFGSHDSNSVAGYLTVDVIDNSQTAPFWCYPYATYTDSGSAWGPTKWATGGTYRLVGSETAMAYSTGYSHLLWDLSDHDIVSEGYSNSPDSIGVSCSIPAATSLGTSSVKQIESR